jgi:hypothetical protein
LPFLDGKSIILRWLGFVKVCNNSLRRVRRLRFSRQGGGLRGVGGGYAGHAGWNRPRTCLVLKRFGGCRGLSGAAAREMARTPRFVAAGRGRRGFSIRGFGSKDQTPQRRSPRRLSRSLMETKG